MAQIRVSFSTALFALSFAVCLLVALFFVDRERQQSSSGKQAATQVATGNPTERELVTSSAFPSQESTARTTNLADWQSRTPPVLAEQDQSRQQQPPTDGAVELPLDPQISGASMPDTAQQLTPQQAAALSPEELARKFEGRARIPAGALSQGAPAIAVPAGLAQAQVAAPVITPAPRSNRRAQPYLPILTNSSGTKPPIATAVAPGAVNGITQYGNNASLTPDPKSRSAARLREALAANAGLQPNGLPIEEDTAAAANSNTQAGWSAIGPSNPGASARVGTAAPVANPVVPSASAHGSFVIKDGKTEPAAGGGIPSSISTSTAGQASLLPIQDADASLPVSAGNANVPVDPAKATNPPPELSGRTQAEEARLSAALEPSPSAELAAFPMDAEDKIQLSVSDKAVAARVNDRVLTARDAGRRAEALAVLDGRKIDNDSRRAMTRTVTEQWAEVAAVADEAKRQGVHITDDEVDKYLTKLPGFDQGGWRKAMGGAGFTENEIKADLRDIAVSEKLAETMLMSKYDESKLREIYDKNPDNFRTARRLRVQEIFRKRPKDEAAAREVERDMQKLQRQAASGADFGLLATQISEADTRAKGGDLGWLNEKSKISEPMAKALLPLKPGEVSAVIAEADGYRLLRLAEVDEPKPGFDGAREQVIAGLKAAMRGVALQSAKAHAKIDLTHKSKKATTVASNSNSNSNREALGRAFRSGKTSPATGGKQPSGRTTASSSPTPQSSADIAAAAQSVPAGFGDPINTAGVASAGAPAGTDSQQSRPKNPITGFFSKFRKPTVQ